MPQQLRPHMRSLALPVGAGQCRATALAALFKIFYGSFATRDISFRSVALNPMLPRALPLAVIIFAGCSAFCKEFYCCATELANLIYLLRAQNGQNPCYARN